MIKVELVPLNALFGFDVLDPGELLEVPESEGRPYDDGNEIRGFFLLLAAVTLLASCELLCILPVTIMGAGPPETTELESPLAAS